MSRTSGIKRVHKKPEERQQEILRAATIVFAERGYQSADVQAIADRAKVGKGTVYRYFPTKEELFAKALSQSLDNLRVAIESAATMTDDPLEKLRATMRAYLRYFEQHPEILELFAHERAEFNNRCGSQYFIRMEQNRDEWLQLFEDIKDKYPTRDLSTEDMMDFCGLVLHGAVVLFQADIGQRNPSERIDQFFDMCLNGLMKKNITENQ